MMFLSRLMAAGCDHVITMDLHDPQFQGKFFDLFIQDFLIFPSTIFIPTP